MYYYRNPISRYEVKQLKKAMEEMMEKIGANEDVDDVMGPTQVVKIFNV